MEFDLWNPLHIQAGVGTFALSMFSYLFFKPKKRVKVPVQQVAHRLVCQDVDLLRENKRLAVLVVNLERENKYWKRQSEIWMPKDENRILDIVSLEEAEDWIQ